MSGKKQRGHVPYRDKASQGLMKRMHEREPASQDPDVESHGHETEEEPEVEPPGVDTTPPPHDLPGAQSNVVELTSTNFDELVGQDKAVVMDFYAPWW